MERLQDMEGYDEVIRKLLTGLTPEQVVLALPDEVLRGLSDEYIASLSEPARTAISQRLGR
jgi:hypothetical protein